MKKVLNAVSVALADAAKLRNKQLAASVVALVAVVVSPFGLNVGPDGQAIIGALTAVGLVASVLDVLLVRARAGRALFGAKARPEGVVATSVPLTPPAAVKAADPPVK